MKRLGYAVLALACAAAGALTSVVLAGGVGAAGFLTTGTTTGTTSTGTTTTTPLPTLIAPGVTISGVPVGGMTADEAATVVRERYELAIAARPRPPHRLAPAPEALGATRTRRRGDHEGA